ncbi:hypothetical protein CAEBREN_10814 [Caenorhabditis brenneri]|uniref:Uncharacterized protein n=1 Tax=Caenorhabditis brenneri TaxID=135651 RepID=G0MFA7_CAEBE|nr:hypothetical protein CAEBREN_10814 [Caenorhabditis brenneri]
MTSKPKEPHRTTGRKLTMTASSMTSEEEQIDGTKTEDEKSKTEEEPEKPDEKSIETTDEDRKVACGNKKDPKDKSEETPDSKDAKRKEDNKNGEQEIILDETNPHFAFLLGGENRDIQQSVFHARHCLEQTAAFQWTMKKRLAFDEGCWKQLSRRISAIRAEGFDVRVNTRQAKENKQSADRETKLDVIFAKWSAGKPKKKGAE